MHYTRTAHAPTGGPGDTQSFGLAVKRPGDDAFIMTRDEICSKFIESVPFDLYPFQEEALLAWFESEGGLLVSAPTGMGKTLLAEAAIFEALHTRRRLYYTTPLIALTDQKYREIQELAERWGFSRNDIGLITGNRKENPDALIRVVVAEILLNHLLMAGPEGGCGTGVPPVIPAGETPVPHASAGTGAGRYTSGKPVPHQSEEGGTPAPPSPAGGTAASPPPTGLDQLGTVVMDEFHSFNDQERGVVWELSLVLLSEHVRVMLLSATVGNPHEFAGWLREQHGRDLKVVLSNQRRVPLEFVWVGDRLMTEHLPAMISASDEENRVPALVFCFNRDECWEVAERMKGLPLINAETRAKIEEHLAEVKDDFVEGVGPKLRQMLIRGVGVHHAGVLPKHKEVVERLFHRKLIPFVICTETLAAGINLPARSVVLSTLLKGKRGEKKLIWPAAAHQMFGRAGRPQFDTRGYVYVLAPEDDVQIVKWKRKYEQIDPKSKDPGIMRARKDLERKKPSRRKTEQYWSEGQFRQLIEAGPANLFSRSMMPYQVLIYLLTRTGTLDEARAFVARRFNTAERIASFQEQLDFMLNNLAGLGYLTRSEDGHHVQLNERIHRLLAFRSVDPLYGAFLAEQLARGSFDEKVQALESVLQIPPAIERKVRVPDDKPPGPLQKDVLEPLLIQMGVVIARGGGAVEEPEDEDDEWLDDEEERPPTFPEMLKIVFEAGLAAPEPVFLQPKWVGGGILEFAGEFYKFVRARELIKQEGLILRHLLRLVILAGEFTTLTEDPEYQQLGEAMTRACQQVDARYTDRFLEEQKERAAVPLP